MGFDNNNKNGETVYAKEHQAIRLIIRRYVDGIDSYKIIIEELEKLGIKDAILALESIEVLGDYSDKIEPELKTNLLHSGVKILDNKKSILAKNIKNVIIDMINYAGELPKMKNSDYISEKLGYNYTYLANTFSEAQGTTIQQFIILHKVEKVKELIFNDRLNLSEIAYNLHYSSAAHLSNQFKNVTGHTPTSYRSLKEKDFPI
ncbi:MAG: AraC-like DNA-binding protein [Roseivirga sp.]|jgi:AraC-like DNA-binding protein